MQKVMANNKLKEKKQQLQHLLKPSTPAQSANNADENEPFDAVGEPDEDSFVVTPDYIQQSKKILFTFNLKSDIGNDSNLSYSYQERIASRKSKS